MNFLIVDGGVSGLGLSIFGELLGFEVELNSGYGFGGLDTFVDVHNDYIIIIESVRK